MSEHEYLYEQPLTVEKLRILANLALKVAPKEAVVEIAEGKIRVTWAERAQPRPWLAIVPADPAT